MTAAGRHLDWEGCLNVRDLGGLPAAEGRVTRRGAVARSDSPAGLTPAGWSALRVFGIRTIVDLRNDDERITHTAAAGLDTVHVPWTTSATPGSGGGSGPTAWTARPATSGRSPGR